MKAFLNRPEDLVTESIDGLVASVPFLARLDGYPSIKVVYDTRFDGDATVAVLSGGGSGHEPAFAGYIGTGFLAAAVCGDTFASPPEEAVLAAIRQVTGSKGCVLIINNYTGDRLHFGAAVERARVEGFKVELVLNADDCALATEGSAVGRRGLAGGIFAMKAAGAAATAGSDLETVKNVAQRACDHLGTMGVALTVCTIPGAKAAGHGLADDEMGMGLGLHGEPGAYTAKIESLDEIAAEMVDRIAGTDETKGPRYISIASGDPVALLVNNLGGTTGLEMGAAARAAFAAVTQRLGARLERVYVGNVMMSLDMKGMSFSILKLGPNGAGDDVAALLDAPTDASGWPAQGGVFIADKKPTPVPKGATDDDGVAKEADNSGPEAQTVLRCVAAACAALEAAMVELDALDGAVGDGDCGSTLAAGARGILAGISKVPLADPAATAIGLARLVGTNIGGSSGAILKIFFSSAGLALRGRKGPLTVDSAAAALAAGVAAVSTYGGAQRGDRTMVDALGPAADALAESAAKGEGAVAAAAAAAAAATAGAEATKEMKARAGRSTYVPEEVTKGVTDPGAVAVARWVGAVAEALAA